MWMIHWDRQPCTHTMLFFSQLKDRLLHRTINVSKQSPEVEGATWCCAEASIGLTAVYEMHGSGRRLTGRKTTTRTNQRGRTCQQMIVQPQEVFNWFCYSELWLFLLMLSFPSCTYGKSTCSHFKGKMFIDGRVFTPFIIIIIRTIKTAIAEVVTFSSLSIR